MKEIYPNSEAGLKQLAEVYFTWDGAPQAQRLNQLLALLRAVQENAYRRGIEYERLRADRWADTQWGA